MKPACAAILATGVVLAACAPYPVYVYPAPTPLLTDQGLLDECTVIRREITRQQRIAEQSGVMTTALVEASVWVNASNVIHGLQQRAAIAGCPV